MYDDFGFFKADPYLHTMTFGFRDKIISIKREHFSVKSFGYCTLWIIMGNIWKDIIIHDMSRKN